MFEMIPFRRNNLSRRDDFFAPFRGFFDNDFFPDIMNVHGNFRVDLKETNDNYEIEADLPGVRKEDIDIDFDNNYLTISAKRDDSIEEKSENYIRRERHYGEFKRSFYVDDVDEEKVQASFNNGVLKVILPKLNKGTRKGRKIDIE